MGDLKRQNKQKSKAPAPPPQEEETEIGEPRFSSPEKDIALATLDNVIQEAEQSIEVSSIDNLTNSNINGEINIVEDRLSPNKDALAALDNVIQVQFLDTKYNFFVMKSKYTRLSYLNAIKVISAQKLLARNRGLQFSS